MGNLGGASSLCVQKGFETEKMMMKCPSGLLIIGKNTQYGLMSKQVKQKIHCTESSIWQAENKNETTNCSTAANFDKTSFFATLKKNCHLKRSCEIPLGTTLPYSPLGADHNCKSSSFVYVQTSCQIEKEF